MVVFWWQIVCVEEKNLHIHILYLNLKNVGCPGSLPDEHTKVLVPTELKQQEQAGGKGSEGVKSTLFVAIH